MIITDPYLLIDKEKCLRNIQFMADKAKRHNLTFRPHLKTPQSAEIANWYKDFGVTKITVSSLKMAEYFASDGWTINWEDVTIAFPVNILQTDRISKLASKINLNILIACDDVVGHLNKELTSKVNFFIKIDTGYHRSGIELKNIEEIESILKKTDKNKLVFKGFLAHSGHSYNAKSFEEINAIHNYSLDVMRELKSTYIDDYPDLITSIGDTPSCSLMEDFTGINEIRPGNFIFYDLAQWKIGSCSLDKIAVAMSCPVISKNRDRQEILVHGGGIHFAKDVSSLEDGTPYYGFVVKLKDKGWEIPDKKSYVRALCQEHGVIKASDELFKDTNIGDRIGILPIHSCMTADCMKKYYTPFGDEISMMNF